MRELTVGTLGVWKNVKSSGRRRNVPEAEHLKDKLIRNTEYAGLRKKKGEGGEREAFAIKKRYYATLPNTDDVPRVPSRCVLYITPYD